MVNSNYAAQVCARTLLYYNYIVVIREYPTPYESEDSYQEREEKGDEETMERAGFAGEEEGGSGHGDMGGVVTAAKWHLRHGRVDHEGECV